LENKVVELGIVDRASDSTIGRALKKTLSSPIADSNGSWSCKNAGGVSLTDRDQVVALFRAVLRLGLEATLVRRRTILNGGP